MRKMHLEKHWNYRRNCFENIFDLDIDLQEVFINFMFVVISFCMNILLYMSEIVLAPSISLCECGYNKVLSWLRW